MFFTSNTPLPLASTPLVSLSLSRAPRGTFSNFPLCLSLCDALTLFRLPASSLLFAWLSGIRTPTLTHPGRIGCFKPDCPLDRHRDKSPAVTHRRPRSTPLRVRAVPELISATHPTPSRSSLALGLPWTSVGSAKLQVPTLLLLRDLDSSFPSPGSGPGPGRASCGVPSLRPQLDQGAAVGASGTALGPLIGVPPRKETPIQKFSAIQVTYTRAVRFTPHPFSPFTFVVALLRPSATCPSFISLEPSSLFQRCTSQSLFTNKPSSPSFASLKHSP